MTIRNDYESSALTLAAAAPAARPAVAVAVGASGDQRIDGVLSGTRWAGPVTYSDPPHRADYAPSYPEFLSDFRQISARQLAVVHAALDLAGGLPGHGGFSAEGFTNLAIAYHPSGAGDIRLANTSDPSTAYTYYPASADYGGDVFFGGAGRLPTTGDYDYFTMIHELGHALGLKHGNEADVFGALPAATDSMEFSVMTYRAHVGAGGAALTNEAWGFAQTYMMDDIAALQYLYGADFTSNAGNTTYSWNAQTGATYVNGALALDPGANRVFETVWDGNGVDTYDLSNYTAAVSVDLTPGGCSTLAHAQLAYLGGGPNGGFARGNVFNARQYHGDARSLIENVLGGAGNDTIRGNVAANTLSGNAGNDLLRGGSGGDRLNGGPGADTLIGGAGTDTFVFATGGSPRTAPDILRADGAVAAFQGPGAAAGDHIDLSAYDAAAGRAGLQHFVLGGGHAVGHLWQAEQGASTVILGNTAGDAAPEFELLIDDHGIRAAAYTAADYLGLA